MDASSEQRGILVVEDNRDNCQLIEWILEDRGWQPTCVTSGETALDFLRRPEHGAVLVLMDISLPGIDGKETTHRIRDELGLHDLPIIAVTAHAIMRERDAILGCGVDDLVTKPIDEEQLLKCMDRLLARG